MTIYWCPCCNTAARNVTLADGPYALIVCYEGVSHTVVDPEPDPRPTKKQDATAEADRGRSSWANAHHPRIDLIAEHQGTGEAVAIDGTPTPGATLDNLYGAPYLPAEHKVRAYVLVPPTPTALRDRRADHGRRR